MGIKKNEHIGRNWTEYSCPEKLTKSENVPQYKTFGTKKENIWRNKHIGRNHNTNFMVRNIVLYIRKAINGIK